MRTIYALVFAVCSAASAAAETPIELLESGEVRRICTKEGNCLDLPYEKAIEQQSLPLPPAVEAAFTKGYVLIEGALRTTAGPIERSRCSGFLIDKENGLVVSGHHCLPPYVKLLDGGHMRFRGIPLTYIASIVEADLALLQLAEVPPDMEALPYKEAVVQEPVYSRSLQFVNYLEPSPANKTHADSSVFMGPVTIAGTISSKGEIGRSAYSSRGADGLASYDVIPTEFEVLRVMGERVESGFSGGPLFNYWGEVVGTWVSSGTAERSDTAFASSAKNFPALLAKYKPE